MLDAVVQNVVPPRRHMDGRPRMVARERDVTDVTRGDRTFRGVRSKRTCTNIRNDVAVWRWRRCGSRVAQLLYANLMKFMNFDLFCEF